mgnify:CR=1 FL=1
MKIGYFADGPWSHKALENIVSSSLYEVVFIVPRFDNQDPVLKEWASKLDIPFLCAENVNSAEFMRTLGEFPADLFVSMSFNQILQKEIIDLAPKGFINCHAGALPFYRGRNPLNWVLINGEDHFGITVHYVDKGIDTGDIIEQKLFPISDADDYKSLLSRAIPGCADVLLEALNKIKKGENTSINQAAIHPVGSYFGMRKLGDEVLDFRWNALKIFNFVRAISEPGPSARIWLDGQEYAVMGCSLIPEAPVYISTIGEVVGRTKSGVVVKVGDSTILLTKIKKITNQCKTDYEVPSFRIGTRFDIRGNCL